MAAGAAKGSLAAPFRSRIVTIMRTIVERLMRGVSFKRRLPAAFGRRPIIVSPDAQLKVLKPGPSAFDPGLMDAAQRLVRPDQNVWDVGANMGVFSLAAAHLSRTGTILGIEADPWLSELLRRTAALNPSLSIHVVPAAVSDHVGEAILAIAARGRAASHLSHVHGSSQSGGCRTEVVVPCITLDSLLDTFAAPDLIKIDVEGAELLVLRGMKRLLEEARPLIYCEVRRETLPDALAIMGQHQYEARDLRSLKPIADPADNVLFAHREMREFA